MLCHSALQHRRLDFTQRLQHATHAVSVMQTGAGGHRHPSTVSPLSRPDPTARIMV
jgi:hypothetical protein